jgi:predicted RNase H-like nuclease (RuvC/YqgF family)
VISSINEKIGQVEDLEEKLSQISQEPRETIVSKRLQEQQEMLQAEINKYTELRAQLYRDMADQVVTKEEYEEFSRNFESHIENAQKAQESLQKNMEELKKVNVEDIGWVRDIKKYKGIKKLTRRLLVELVECITVYDKEHIKIRYRFSDEFEKLSDAVGTDDENMKEAAAL